MRRLSYGVPLGIILILFSLVEIAAIAISEHNQGTSLRELIPTVAPPLAIYGFAMLCLLIFIWNRLHRSFLIEVNERHLLISLLANRKLIHPTIWPRAGIVSVRRNVSDGTMLVSCSGRDMVSFLPNRNADLIDWVAREITEALATLPALPMDHTANPSDPPPPMAKGPMRTGLIVLAGLLGVAGIVMFFMGNMWSMLSIYVMGIAAIPAGIALGSQKKDLYL